MRGEPLSFILRSEPSVRVVNFARAQKFLLTLCRPCILTASHLLQLAQSSMAGLDTGTAQAVTL